MGNETIRREDAPKDDLVHEKGENKRELGNIVKSGDYRGGNESARLERGKSLLTPMKLDGPEIYRAWGLRDYITQYEIYKIPVYHASQALGRVNDLRDVGAPRTPAEIDARTMAKFKKADTVDKKDTGKQNAANQFIEQQEEMEDDFASYMTARESLQEAINRFRGTQEILRRRALQAKKAGKEGEKAKIDQAADTLVKIVDVAIMAGSAMTALEKGFLSSAAAGEEYTDADVYSEVTGKEVASARTTKTSAAKKAYELAKMAGGKLDLKGIFIWAMGKDDEYRKLQQEIAALNVQIADSEFQQEQLEIRSAQDHLRNVSVTITDRRGAFESKRATNRDAAQTFGQAMGGKERTIVVSLMAEAYQELDLFGSRALEEGQQLHPHAMNVWKWLNQTSISTRVRIENDFDTFKNDAIHVARTIKETEGSTDMFAREVPIWQATARTWKNFLTDVMGKKFDKDSDDRKPS